MQAFSSDEIEAAQRVVYAAMPPTPQYAWPLLRERLGCEVWVKHENHTPLGAFKVRGGLVYLQGLVQREPACRGALPTLIEWDATHPSVAMPDSGVALRALTVRGLPPAAVQALALQGVAHAADAGPAISASFETPRGVVTLDSD